jgi:ABC-type multidrug transport system ATPase subunit
MEEAGLIEAADKQAVTLSSGMCQRLAIARALLKRPEILLLDEPSRSLDATGTERLWKTVRRLSAAGITILLATHNFREVAEACDRIAILQRGRLLDVLPVAVFKERQLQRTYLELAGPERRWSEEVTA